MRRAALIAVALAMAACGGGGRGSDTGRSTSASSTQAKPPAATAPADAGPTPRLTASHPCPAARGFTCSSLAVALEALRVALGADKLTLDGVSYGTFVAERYAIAHPDRVAKLVLDSVVPAAGLDGLEVDGLHETARVLRAVCRAQHCPGDPAAD